MVETASLDAFHFLRPWWLLIVPFALWLHWRLRRAYSAAVQWRGTIAPQLLKHLTVSGRQGRRIRPYQLMTVLLVAGAIALAGPTWRREITPFTEDRAPLVIALELTTSMLSIDQPPTRLERAKQKIRDLLQRRKGARTAIVAYAGSAHAAVPPSDDIRLIETYLESLSPALMPRPGDDAKAALALAEQILEREKAAGTILFMTDGIDRTNAPDFAAHHQRTRDQVLILALGTEQGGPIRLGERDRGLSTRANRPAPGADLAGLDAIASAVGSTVVRATVDDGDIDRLGRRIRSHLVNAIESDDRLQWHDAGYYLVWPLALLLLLWARRGWTVQWA